MDSIDDHFLREKCELIIIEHTEEKNVTQHTLDVCERASSASNRVILINGAPDNEFLAKAFANGLCDYFAEPLREDLLIERVYSLLKVKTN